MSIITKTKAAEVARKLTCKKAEQLQKISAELGEEFTKMYVSALHPELLKTFRKFPSYFNCRADFQVSGNGLAHEWVNIASALPCSGKGFAPDEAQAKVIREFLDNITAIGKELRELRRDIEATLWSLRSYKKIREHLPEAAPFLDDAPMALAINFSHLRQRLND